VNKSLWKFTGEDGKTWNSAASVDAIPGEKNKLAVKISIARGDANSKR
jgi:hypothetical protein